MTNEAAALGSAIYNPFLVVWAKLSSFTPALIYAALILVIGWLVAVVLGDLVTRLLRICGFQTLMEKIKIEQALDKAKIGKDVSSLIGLLVRWVIILVAFIAAADKLRLPEVADFLNKILGYVPNVAAAAGILIIGIYLSQFLANVITGAMAAGELKGGSIVGSVVRYSVLVFTYMAVLLQLGIATEVVRYILIALLAMFALAGGLAFGLGSKDAAQNLVDSVKKEIKG